MFKKAIINNESGQGLTEYLVLLILIALISVAGVQTMGGTIKRKFVTANSHIDKIRFE